MKKKLEKKCPASKKLTSVEIFSGLGGLALGTSLAGFKPLAILEWDKFACSTIRKNKNNGFHLINEWPLYETDVRNFDWSTITDEIDLLAGGPPCQPFSIGGKHQSSSDTRDMFPTMVEVIRRLRPKAFIIENVKGITRPAFSTYFRYIQLQLEFPELTIRVNESANEHLLRLNDKSSKIKSKKDKSCYNVKTYSVNAADYGIPQKRERIFIIGFRSDLNIEYNFPSPTHSQDRLIFDQWVSDDYWIRHDLKSSKRPKMGKSLFLRTQKIQKLRNPLTTLPWNTIRDAFVDLPSPILDLSGRFANHEYHAGAKVYPGHTGSPIDFPAKTLKAGTHGVPGGENMLVDLDGSVRFFTIRESARLQTFPDDYIFYGSWSEIMRQLGNAVPVKLAQIIAQSVAEKII